MKGLTRLLLALALVVATGARAGVEILEFDDAGQEARYKDLIAELRCLVCQNQNLADSDADLAKDLRRETYKMVRAGRSDEEIISFMVDRYGEFVLYRPPVKSSTVLLWFGPFALALIGALVLVVQIRRRRAPTGGAPEADLSPAEKARVDALLGAATDRPEDRP